MAGQTAALCAIKCGFFLTRVVFIISDVDQRLRSIDTLKLYTVSCNVRMLHIEFSPTLFAYGFLEWT